MAKTLVLVVDRDDDFGVKGGVETPVIGLDGNLNAAMKLGTADPEDSDVNALFSAINVYKELKSENKDVEIALVCGDAKVGHKSDMAVIEEITKVLDEVKPDNAILVGDGAEDEYVYPIISSRVPIDSVKKVYVKQTPGVEGALYIFTKMLSDPYKKKRFLSPIGVIVCLLGLVFMIGNLLGFSSTGKSDYLVSLTGPLVVFIIGVAIIMFANNTINKFTDMLDEWNTSLHKSNITMVFTTLAVAMLAIGLFIAAYSVKDIWGSGITYVSLTFVENLMWPIGIVYLISNIGKLVASHVHKTKANWGGITSNIMLFGIMFVMQSVIDFILLRLEYNDLPISMIIAEVAVGVVLMVLSSLLHSSIKKHADPETEELDA